MLKGYKEYLAMSLEVADAGKQRIRTEERR